MRTHLPLVVALLVGACGPEPDPRTSHPVAEPSAAAPASPFADRCEPPRARFRAASVAATGACATDAECGCFNPVVDEAGCGGVTDATTAAALAAIERDFHAASCPWPHQCAPWACEPTCRAGRCVNAGSGA
jgi:hypothetical protein